MTAWAEDTQLPRREKEFGEWLSIIWFLDPWGLLQRFRQYLRHVTRMDCREVINLMPATRT